jgi:hypothetical protein
MFSWRRDKAWILYVGGATRGRDLHMYSTFCMWSPVKWTCSRENKFTRAGPQPVFLSCMSRLAAARCWCSRARLVAIGGLTKLNLTGPSTAPMRPHHCNRHCQIGPSPRVSSSTDEVRPEPSRSRCRTRVSPISLRFWRCPWPCNNTTHCSRLSVHELQPRLVPSFEWPSPSPWVLWSTAPTTQVPRTSTSVSLASSLQGPLIRFAQLAWNIRILKLTRYRFILDWFSDYLRRWIWCSVEQTSCRLMWWHGHGNCQEG